MMKVACCLLVGIGFFLFYKIYFRGDQTSLSSRAPLVDFEYLSDLAKNPDVNSVEKLLSALPTSFRESYVLIHDSQSTQEADYQNPRVVMLGYKYVKNPGDSPSPAVIAFNGSQIQNGYNEVEIIQWRESEAKFEFRSISFNDGHATISNPNPIRCLGCHSRGASEDPLPIWNLYSNWPGTYGANDGQIKNGSREDHEFRNFVNHAKTDPRYSQLPHLQDIDYLSNKRASFSDVPWVDGYYIEPTSGDGLVNLSQFFAEKAALRFLRKIQRSPNFRPLRQTFVCALFDHATDIVSSDEKRLIQQLYTLQNEYSAAIRIETALSTEFAVQDIRGSDDLDFDFGDDVLFWLANQFLGVPSSTLSYAPQSKYAAFVVPKVGNFRYLVRQAMALQKDPDIISFLLLTEDGQRDACLKSLSVRTAQIAKIKPCLECRARFVPAGPVSSKFVNPALGKCVKCHTQDGAPALPFLVPSKLKLALREGLLSKIQYRLSDQAAKNKDSMPPNTHLSKLERSELLTYLLNLAGSPN
jgi:hypothetical protein